MRDGPLGRLGAAATLGQHCPQMTERPGSAIDEDIYHLFSVVSSFCRASGWWTTNNKISSYHCVFSLSRWRSVGTASRNLVILLIDVLVIVFIDCHLALTSSVRSSLLEFLHVFPHAPFTQRLPEQCAKDSIALSGRFSCAANRL